MKNCLIVINSLSSRSHQILKELKLQIQLYPETNFTILLTKFAGDAFRFSYDYTLQGIDSILSCGGDGTLNELVNGAFNAKADNGISFAHYSCGSANDFARTIGKKSLSDLLEMLYKKQYTLIDRALILKDGRIRRIVNESTCGMGALVCRDVELRRKTLNPNLNYLLSIFNRLIRFRKPLVRITLDDKIIETKVLLLIISKGNFVGNGLGLTPQVTLDDGYFGVTILTGATVWQMIRFRSKLTRKEVIDRPEIEYLKSTGVMVEVLNGRLPVETDGEFFDMLTVGEHIEYGVEMKSFKLCY
ncbi:MAG: hypothetical protein NWQ55_08760 [Salibacteraceae bacterium]|nr:hypothetical protein [Salibacteraceae bacterium]